MLTFDLAEPISGEDDGQDRCSSAEGLCFVEDFIETISAADGGPFVDR